MRKAAASVDPAAEVAEGEAASVEVAAEAAARDSEADLRGDAADRAAGPVGPVDQAADRVDQAAIASPT